MKRLSSLASEAHVGTEYAHALQREIARVRGRCALLLHEDAALVLSTRRLVMNSSAPTKRTPIAGLCAALACTALTCGGDKHGGGSSGSGGGGMISGIGGISGGFDAGAGGGNAGSGPGSGDASITPLDGGFGDYEIPPVITMIPVPPNCQNPGFPGGDQHLDFESVRAQLVGMKPMVEMRQADLLAMRYDLSNMPSSTVTMTRGKPIQVGVRVKLPDGQTWDSLAGMSPDAIRTGDLFPAGFYPLPHPNHQFGGMLFTHFVIEELRRQTNNFRNLQRFDLDFDLPDHVLPEFPPAMFLTNHKELGDVSRGQVVTLMNYYELFKMILNPQELEGLRMLVTPFPQQEFNLIDDRRTDLPQMGVACFDCHINGHTSGSIEILPDDRPQPFRRRGDTVSLRGVFQNQIFGSKRGIETVDDFSEFEEKTAYFDGDITQSRKKGQTFLDREVQLQGMAEVQRLLDFPPAPKLDLFGRLDPTKATAAELRGEALFNGKAQCAGCHPPPFYLDNFMHDLQLERFYTPKVINCRAADPDGPIKAFTLRGIKESPPYMHDGRLLTLDDTVEFFNLVLGTKLSAAEKKDLLAFLYTL
jgi:cytochrome c peroxidase